MTKTSMGIDSKDTAEAMIGKMLKTTKVGDYISAEDMSFLSPEITNYIEKITKTNDNTFKITRASRFIDVFKKDASFVINKTSLTQKGKDFNAYKITIKGLTEAAKTFAPASVFYISQDKSLHFKNGEAYSSPIKK